VTRRALGEPPAAVVAAPDPRGGWQVHLAFAQQRPPLAAWELTDVQHAWDLVLRREFGPVVTPERPSETELRAREQDLQQARGALGQAQRRLFDSPSPAVRAAFASALNRVQMAADRLRALVQRADPVRFDRAHCHDSLDFTVTLQGDEGLSLVHRDGAVRHIFARAAALADPSELRVTLRPLRGSSAWHAHVAFNFRNTVERGPQHLNPASLAGRIQVVGPSLPPLRVISGDQVVAHVSLAAVEPARPLRATTHAALELEPPPPLRAPEAPERARA
jgi:hypothetical protein